MLQSSINGIQDKVGLGGKGNLPLCHRLKFIHTNKWYIHKPQSALEN